MMEGHDDGRLSDADAAATASPVLRTEPASGLGPDGRVPHGAFTPGPWGVNKYGSVGAGEFFCRPIIAMVEDFYGPERAFGESAANAALIAAAPDLYEALTAALAVHGDGYSWGKAALAALAKVQS